MGRIGSVGGSIHDGLDTLGDFSARDAPMRTMPRFGIALGEEGPVIALQLRAAFDISHLLRPLSKVRDSGTAPEPRIDGTPCRT